MGRPTVTDKKIHVGCRVKPNIKKALDAIAAGGKWRPSQALEIVVLESPRVKAELRSVSNNGSKGGKK